ncbi:hypothetical protein CEXT_365121 [Caerostris extrusa]|uniref:Uncharacterized protein n=1 Tax=Caerostris extrusa TaxID=172846 RepID=A0AAV4N2X1_CAEEX|nr:hypothetical protein CEXT_365121 [Caerostris extrusa]
MVLCSNSPEALYAQEKYADKRRGEIMTYTIGLILLLFVFYERGSAANSEDEMQDILDKTLECVGRSPPKEPVIALSSKKDFLNLWLYFGGN